MMSKANRRVFCLGLHPSDFAGPDQVGMRWSDVTHTANDIDHQNRRGHRYCAAADTGTADHLTAL